MAWLDKPLATNTKRAAIAILAGLRTAWRAAVTVVARGWPVLRPVLRGAIELLFALILLFEEWGWRPLAALLARLAKYPLVAKVEALISSLPPYGALAVFAAPSLLILPLKLVAIFLIANGHALSAALLFIGAKIAGTAILARLFILTQAKLMQIGWFARGYNWLMPWQERMFAVVRASSVWRYGRIIKYRVGQAIKVRWVEMRPGLLAWRDRMVAQGREALARLRARWG